MMCTTADSPRTRPFPFNAGPKETWPAMVCETFSRGDSLVHRRDPRLRLVAALAFAAVVALSARWPVAAAGAAIGLVLAFLARLPLRASLGRMVGLNVFMVFLLLLMPLSTPGTPLFHVGPLAFTREGLAGAALVALKANAILLSVTALVSTIDVVAMGHAMESLRVPSPLVHLFLFTVRYVDLLHHERQRLSRAMKVRCYRPGLNAHSLRSTGYLVGMLLVRSYERSERVVAAMKCRGFSGRFHPMHTPAWTAQDTCFGIALLLVLGLLAVGGLM